MRKKLLRLKQIVIAAALALGLAGCSLDPEAEGGELIKAARKEYAGLDSARVTMTNLDTGEVEQEFVFKYDEKDTLIYSYYGRSASSEYAQYNNGAEQFTYDNGEYSYCSRGEDSFVRYTRAVTHPQAGEGLLIYSPRYITEATQTETDEGTEVVHVYDPEKIGAAVENGEVTGFRAEYYFDKDGALRYFTEITDAQENGAAKEYAYRVDITDRNAVEKVENTAERFAPGAEGGSDEQ